MMKIRGFGVAVFLLLNTFVFAQETIPAKNRLYFKAEGFSGNSWAHHDAIEYLMDAPPFGGAVSLGLRSSGRKAWEHDLNFPQYGIGYQYSQLGGQLLGNSHALYAFIGSSLINTKHLQWKYSLGAGVGYVDNSYDPIDNPLNLVNGSAFNAFLKISTGVQYSFLKQHAVGADGGLFHLSNGNSALPNWGINVLYLSLNYTYRFNLEAAEKSVAPHTAFRKNTRITLYGGGGLKEEAPIDGLKFGVADLHVNVWRAFRAAHSFGAGITTFYDAASSKIKWRRQHDYLPSRSVYEDNQFTNMSLGVQAGYMLNMDPVYFSFEFGVYIISPIHKDIYNRWMLEYLINDRLRAHLGLKSRFGTADFIVFGLGYDLFRRFDP